MTAPITMRASPQLQIFIARVTGGIRTWEGDRAPSLRSGHTVYIGARRLLIGQPVAVRSTC
jgi:hypothetical protein